MKGIFSWLIIIFVLGFVSCKNEITSLQPNSAQNSPVVTNTTNCFTYSVNANQYSDETQSTLNFRSDSLIVTLTCSEYLSGQAIIAVRDSLSAVIFSDTVMSNKTITVVGMKTNRPKSSYVMLDKFTGKFVFTLIGQQI